MSEVPYFEFNDADDPESSASEQKKEGMSFKIVIEPQLFLMAMIDENEAKNLHPDVLPAVKCLMEISYEQGKKVGQLNANTRLVNAIQDVDGAFDLRSSFEGEDIDALFTLLEEMT